MMRPHPLWRTLLCLPLIASLSLAHAEPKAKPAPQSDTPADYAYALPLTLSGTQGVVALRLPLAVYQRAQTARLDDLRVFDGQGRPQAFALHNPAVTASEQRGQLPATLFAVEALAADQGSALDLDIRTRPDGSVVSVHTRNGGKSGTAAVLQSLILDFGKAASDQPNTRIEALRFVPPTQAGSPPANYNAEVWLEASNDLKHWQTVGATELRWLTNDQSQTLASDRLEISPQAFRYGRLSWRRGEPLRFAAITAETITRNAAEPQRETLWISPTTAKIEGDLAYPANIAIPVEQITLRFSEPNIVFPVAIGHYRELPSRHSGKPTEWVFQPRASASFYQISQSDQTRRSAALSVYGQAAEWVLRPQTPGQNARPELGLSWQPATLVFLAGGTPPYTLAFGRSDAEPAARSLQQVAPNFSAQEIGRLEQATTGPLKTLSDPKVAESTAAAAEQSARLRTYLLWGVLLLGVLVLGALAWRLVKQMQVQNPEQK